MTGSSKKQIILEKLQQALQLEHLTIPPYLTALFSIKDGENLEVARVVRSVVMEEMLHMVEVANVMNALGGNPKLTDPGFTPEYPAVLPFNKRTFRIDLQRLSDSAIDTFMAIERPDWIKQLFSDHVLSEIPAENELDTIGEFYQDIIESIGKLSDQDFDGNAALQVTPEHYYGGGGVPTLVTDKKSAIEALEQVMEQGEGKSKGELGDGDTDHGQNWEPAHYYRFQSLKLGRLYQEIDRKVGCPSGREFKVDYSAVLPSVKNPKVEDFIDDEDRLNKMEAFNRKYQGLLSLIEKAFNGEQAKLQQSVHLMYELKYDAQALMRTPVSLDSDETMGPSYQFIPLD